MILLPAIDLKDGACVRLYQGDYARLSSYSDDPVAVARRWQDAGASWLHIVDLDGAKTGQQLNSHLIERICQTTTLRIEVGGGLRSLEQIAHMLSIGVERVILGTSVLTNRQLLDQALQRWAACIVVGLDTRNGLVAISGWRETSNVKATELARELSAAGVQRFVYTDIARDGAMQGPNQAALNDMLNVLAEGGSSLIAAGGISSLADLQSLASTRVEGAIIGKALYNGAIDLAEAVRVIEAGQSGRKAREQC